MEGCWAWVSWTKFGVGLAPWSSRCSKASSTFKTSHTFGRPTGKPRVRLGPTEGTLMVGWQLWAAGAAVLAALTAVFAKFGVEGIDSNLATLIRNLVLVVAPVGMPAINGQLRWHQLALP